MPFSMTNKVSVPTTVSVLLDRLRLAFGQIGFINIRESSGDPHLEERIFSKLHSPGRQLARVFDVLDLLLEAHSKDERFADDPTTQARVQKFHSMRQEILLEKAKSDPRLLASALEALMKENGHRYDGLRELLNEWLDRDLPRASKANGDARIN